MNGIKIVSVTLATAATLGGSAFSAQAATLIGHDLSQETLPYLWNAPPGTDIHWNDAYDNRKAVGVTLTSGTSYSFDSFTAMLVFVTDAGYLPTEEIRAAIYRDDNGRPGDLLASLGSQVLSDPAPASPFPAMPVTWTAATPVLLSAGNTYWFGLNDATQYSDYALPFAHWTVMASHAAPAGVEALAGYRYSSDGGTTWNSSSVYNAVQIQVTAVPEPETLAMMLAGLGLIGAVVNRRGMQRNQ